MNRDTVLALARLEASISLRKTQNQIIKNQLEAVLSPGNENGLFAIIAFELTGNGRIFTPFGDKLVPENLLSEVAGLDQEKAAKIFEEMALSTTPEQLAQSSAAGLYVYQAQSDGKMIKILSPLGVEAAKFIQETVGINLSQLEERAMTAVRGQVNLKASLASFIQ